MIGSVDLDRYDRRDLVGVVRLCDDEGWSSYSADPERTHRILTAPGVTAVVARQDERVIGFAYIQSDGELQAHLSAIAIALSHRRQGIARRLLSVAISHAGGERIDLITDSAEEFYAALQHKRFSGFRIYPPFT